ncbi:MAG: cupin domain-containing protein, partial [Gemmatimonadetes bacterium]|nr:cupin domain-containing protein [Gemmatimonadota bacterium]
PIAASSCDTSEPPALLAGASRILRSHERAAGGRRSLGWDGVRALPYKLETTLFRGVTRHVLAAPERATFDVRYYEVEPGGHTTHEVHEHVHVIVVLRGLGRVRLGGETHELGFADVVYISPRDPHQFLNPYGEPFGFLCIVDRARDRPVTVEE